MSDRKNRSRATVSTWADIPNTVTAVGERTTAGIEGERQRDAGAERDATRCDDGNYWNKAAWQIDDNSYCGLIICPDI